MKNLFIIATWLYSVTLSPAAYAQTVSKEAKISARFSGVKEKLVIDNRYGKLTINTWDKNEVTVDITVTAKAKSADDAQKILEAISITQPKDKSDGIYYKTVIGKQKHGITSSEMSINYVINMPRRQTAEFTNKFGDIELSDVTGKLTIDLEYGALKTGALSGSDNDIKVSFGSATIAYIEAGSIKSSYSKLSIGKAGTIDVSNQFETTTITSVRDLHIEQKYGDLKIGTVGQLKGSAQFASLSVDKLQKSLQMTLKYSSSASFDNIGPEVDNLDINSSFSSLYFHFDNDASLAGDVDVSFGSVDNNSQNISFTTLRSGMAGQGSSYKAKIGSGRGTLALNVSYGNIVVK